MATPLSGLETMMRFAFSRRGIIILLLLVLSGLLGLWFTYRSDAGAGDIRNVLLISIDTCRADHLSCYGYESKTTPNIDAMAAEGILFENVISPYPMTIPSHSTMLTGTIPPYHGVHANIGGYLADESNITLAEILKEAGFVTGAAVSGFPLKSRFGVSQGFDDYYDLFENLSPNERGRERVGGKTTAVALDWLARNKDKKFFFFLHYFDPHASYAPPEPFASRFASNRYAGEIAYTDHCIGQVLDKLKELGLYDSTLIIITSDHGEMLGEHGEYTHSYFIYQGAIRVPLIFKLPGQNKTVRIKPIAGLVDIVPTVCSLLGIETPKNVQGADLFGRSKGENTSEQGRHLFCESLFPTIYKANSLLGIVTDRYKYIQTTRPELYDLLKDPGESNNLIKEQPQLARVMKDKLAQVLKRTVRKASGDSKMEIDSEASEQLKSLGYVGGSITEDFSFDQTKTDPKDMLEYHTLTTQIHLDFLSKKYDEVQLLAEQAIQQHPNIPFAYRKLGSVAMVKKDYSKAIVYFQKAIELAPDSPDSVGLYHERGNAYQFKGELDLAIDDYSQALKLNPGAAEIYNNRGHTYLRKGELDQAIRDLNQALKLNPRDAKAYNNRAKAYSRKERYDLAISDFGKVIALDPTHAHAYNNLAWILATHEDEPVRDGERAVQLAKKACELTDYKNPVSLDTLAAAYAQLGQFDEAVKIATRAMRLARATKNEKIAKDIQSRLELYKDKRPYREQLSPDGANAPQ